MRRYIVDTTPLAAYLLGRRWATDALDPLIDRHELATSILVYGEVTEYLRGLPDFSNRRTQLRRQLREVRPYLLTYPVMERYADLRRRLRPPHGPGLIGDIDTLIAATALDRRVRLLTADTDFRRVPDLDVDILRRS